MLRIGARPTAVQRDVQQVGLAVVVVGEFLGEHVPGHEHRPTAGRRLADHVRKRPCPGTGYPRAHR
ncbi:hypothetical protein [uncultured Corynebacterium sp.]|uniref:hypothetical protein n=1 Tax=uncultured Corynebacterium sp. TaxID=159447 RepID=UPI0025CD419F|nr:hypothetical protein [uncultured Corynebacterium sp.]